MTWPTSWDGVADVAELFSKLIGQANDKVLELGKLGPGSRVLDVGCGTGELARKAASLVGDTGTVIGIDASTRMVEVAKSRSAESESLQFHVHDAQELRFQDGVCDAMFCQMALPFFERPEAFLTRARSVLKDGGRLVLMCPGRLEHNEFFRAPEVLDEGALARLTAFGAAGELVPLLERAGFEEVRTRPVRALARIDDAASYWRIIQGALGVPGEPPPSLDRIRPGTRLSLEIIMALALKPNPGVERNLPVQSFENVVARARREIRELSPFEVSRALGKQTVRWVDVREPDEWAHGAIKGALRIPRGELERHIGRELPDRSTVIIVYCQDGNVGALAASRLRALGYGAVWNLYGGFAAWKQDRMPIERVRD